jgi:hypothetical protein
VTPPEKPAEDTAESLRDRSGCAFLGELMRLRRPARAFIATMLEAVPGVIGGHSSGDAVTSPGAFDVHGGGAERRRRAG